MARTEIRGGAQIKNLSILREDLVPNFLGGSNWDITGGANNFTITGLPYGLQDDDVVTLGQLNDTIAGLGGLIYKGVLDAATPSPDLDAINNTKGDFYKISVAGTYLGQEWAIGDMLIVNKDVAAGTTITGADVDKIDNTEDPLNLKQADVVDNLSSNGVANYPLSANQGYVLDQKIQVLESNSYTFVPLAIYAITNNSPIVADLANTPATGREMVYNNGVRMLKGSGNDYTISGATITMEYNLHTNDQITVEYYY